MRWAPIGADRRHWQLSEAFLCATRKPPDYLLNYATTHEDNRDYNKREETQQTTVSKSSFPSQFACFPRRNLRLL